MKLKFRFDFISVAVVATVVIFYFLIHPTPQVVEQPEPADLPTFGPSQCMDTPECTEKSALDGNISVICKMSSAAPCACAALSCHESEVAAKCKDGWTDKGETIKGLRCCHNEKSECTPEKEAEIKTKTPQSETFWATVDGKVRSPVAGRQKIEYARLDACLGWEDTETFINPPVPYNEQRCLEMCASPGSNEFCRDSGLLGKDTVPSRAVRCMDRCACAFSVGNCQGL